MEQSIKIGKYKKKMEKANPSFKDLKKWMIQLKSIFLVLKIFFKKDDTIQKHFLCFKDLKKKDDTTQKHF